MEGTNIASTNIAIIGSGPAGYTAALYTARAKLEPVVFAGQKSGGQLMLTTVIENYPGFKEGIDGPNLMIQMREQAQKFGAKMVDEYVTAVDFSSRPFKIWTNIPAGATGQDFEKKSAQELLPLFKQIKQTSPALLAKSVIVATGAVAKMLGVAGEEKFLGRGVSTCAVCDAAFYKDKITYGIGGGDSAMEEALALTKFAKEIYILYRADSLRASKIMQDRVLQNNKVKVIYNTQLKEIIGDKQVKQIKVVREGKEETYLADGVFLAIGHKPATSIFANQLQLDQQGYLVTGQSVTSLGVRVAQSALSPKGLVAFPTMTSVEGVFGAGDVVDVIYRQAVTAAGQGCSAALDAQRWLEQQS
jgi:thioredoxin reductase (NADPH)